MEALLLELVNFFETGKPPGASPCVCADGRHQTRDIEVPDLNRFHRIAPDR
jgi:hypothetical protein